VTIIASRHSGVLLAGIQKNSLDTGLRRYDETRLDAFFVYLYLAEDLALLIHVKDLAGKGAIAP